MSDETYKEVFSRNLRRIMIYNNKTQMDLMKDLHLSSSTVSNWCTGLKMPRIGKIQLLADYFGVEKSDLLEAKESEIVSDSDIQMNQLSKICSGLTADGIQRVIEYAEDLTHNPKYQKKKPSEED